MTNPSDLARVQRACCVTSKRFVPEPSLDQLLRDLLLGLKRFKHAVRWEFFWVQKKKKLREVMNSGTFDSPSLPSLEETSSSSDSSELSSTSSDSDRSGHILRRSSRIRSKAHQGDDDTDDESLDAGGRHLNGLNTDLRPEWVSSNAPIASPEVEMFLRYKRTANENASNFNF